MAAHLRLLFTRNFFLTHRGLATSSALYSNGAKKPQDPIQKLFIDKLKEYETKSKAGQVAMTPAVCQGVQRRD